MRPAYVVEIVTPKKFLLNGLWFGSKKPKTAIIWVHGLASSAFSKIGIVENLIDKDTAVLTFNNRGHDAVTRALQLTGKKKTKKILAGGAHEVFTDCIDDIEGAVNFAKKQGAKKIFLAGHSTGAQKSAYFAAKKQKGVSGIILLAPMSDYAGAVHADAAAVARGARAARKLVAAGKKHAIVPLWWMDAQRFLSLHTPESVEEIFSYANPTKKPRTYQSVKVPLLVLLPEEDEYRDRPMDEIAAWFKTFQRSRRFSVNVFPDADHGFSGFEKEVAQTITQWISA
jgi:alpha-beta hydrolase superfamily lysophospholipase